MDAITSNVREKCLEEVKESRRGNQYKSINKISHQVYIGGLPLNVSKASLEEKFRKYGKVEHVLILKSSQIDKQHGYVTLNSHVSAEKAIKEMNRTNLFGKTVVVNWADPKGELKSHAVNGNPVAQKSESEKTYADPVERISDKNANGNTKGFYPKKCNTKNTSEFEKILDINANDNSRDKSKSGLKAIYVGGLPLNVSQAYLKEQFEKFGRVENIKLLKSLNNEQHSYIYFHIHESAEKASKAMNKTAIFGNIITVNIAYGKTDRAKALYVAGLPSTVNESAVKELFEKHGEVISVKLYQGQFEQFGFVNFVYNDSAERAIVALNMKTCFGETIKVSWANASFVKKAHRPAEKAPLQSSKSKVTEYQNKMKENQKASSDNQFGEMENDFKNLSSFKTATSFNESIANQSINHRLSSIIHGYNSSLVSRASCKENVSAVQYVLEVSIKGELENLVNTLKRIDKGDGADDVESLRVLLIETVEACDWTRLASFYNQMPAFSNTWSKMTESDVLARLRWNDEKIIELESRVDTLKNNLLKIVSAFEDIEEGDGVKSVPDVEETLRKVKESLDQPTMVLDEEMMIWAKLKIEDVLDKIDSAWNLLQGDSNMENTLKHIENPLSLFGNKYCIKSNSEIVMKGDKESLISPSENVNVSVADLREIKDITKENTSTPNSSMLEEPREEKVGGFYDSGDNFDEESSPRKSSCSKTTETGYMQVQEIKTLIETYTEQCVTKQMNDLLNLLDRDHDGWVFYQEFEDALTPELLKK